MWIVGIIALVLFAWWWAARQRAIQRLKMQVAIRTGARAAFERWRAPDNDQIVEAIYEAAQPPPSPWRNSTRSSAPASPA